MQAVLLAGADELLDEIHAAAGFHPAVVGVDIVGFQQDLELEEDRAVQRQVAKRGEPRGGIDQLIADDEWHRGSGISMGLTKFRCGRKFWRCGGARGVHPLHQSYRPIFS